MSPVLQVIVASTRPGRVGRTVGDWFTEYAQKDARFSVQMSDLAEINLPFLDEPKHPAMGDYQHEHTKQWSQTIAGSDAFVFVLPEYNFSFPAAVKNAVDFLFHEWAKKPVSFVSYGGVSGGLRSVEAFKPVCTALQMQCIREQVPVPFVHSFLQDGVFVAEEIHEKSAADMLTGLLAWHDTLSPARAKEDAAQS